MCAIGSPRHINDPLPITFMGSFELIKVSIKIHSCYSSSFDPFCLFKLLIDSMVDSINISGWTLIHTVWMKSFVIRTYNYSTNSARKLLYTCIIILL